MIKPAHRLFLRDHAGKWVETESAAFSLLPEGEPILLCGDPELKYVPGQWLALCWLCRATVALHPKDRAIIIEHPKITYLCHSCYFQMDPEVVP
jgi:hypothetical protein